MRLRNAITQRARCSHVRRVGIAGDCAKLGQHLQRFVVVEEIAGCSATASHNGGKADTNRGRGGKTRAERKQNARHISKTKPREGSKTSGTHREISGIDAHEVAPATQRPRKGGGG